MGNSSSSKEKSAVVAESKEDVLMTAEDTEKAERFLKDLEKSDKYWEDLAAQWDVKGEISKTTLIESMRGMVSQSSGYSILLKEMEKPISKVCNLTQQPILCTPKTNKKKKNNKTKQNKKN